MRGGRVRMCLQVMRRVMVFVKEVQDFVWPTVVCYLTQQVQSAISLFYKPFQSIEVRWPKRP